jgi:glycosyltransferase involved in cell wall biosynthesis
MESKPTAIDAAIDLDRQTNANSTNIESACNQTSQILLFDLSVRGHHPNYIKYLIHYWQQHPQGDRLNILVSPRFLTEHTDVVALADHHSDIRFVAITPSEAAALPARKSSWQRALRVFQEWQLLCKYARELAATHCLLLYFDTYQLPFLLAKPAPCSVSGVYFRPSFHYQDLNGYQPTRKERWLQQREKFLLSRILTHPQLHTLFCLDPFAVEKLNQRYPQKKAVSLPDPVITSSVSQSQVAELQQRLGIEPHRRVFLLFGALTERKGVFQLLEAIRQQSSQLCQQMCLCLVGESRIASRIESRLSDICQIKPLQAIQQYEFISDEQVRAYFQIADVILAPYQKHIGMSGILLLAAAAEKPILSSDYGLMGELVRRHRLGVCVDSTSPATLAKGLEQCFRVSTEELGDRETMRAFAKQNAAEKFAQTIFQRLAVPATSNLQP